MNPEKRLRGKTILVVDDEADVLETLIDLLEMSRLDTASSFEEAKTLLEQNSYDLAILDIMGVDGYGLLEIANERKIPAIMFTAHALDEENLVKSIQNGSASFIPKEKMSNIAEYAADVLQAIEKGKNPWERWLEKLGGFFDKQFSGTNWRKQKEAFDKELIEKYKHWL
jgi:DNA-binding NtrC family response regulator